MLGLFAVFVLCCLQWWVEALGNLGHSRTWVKGASGHGVWEEQSTGRGCAEAWVWLEQQSPTKSVFVSKIPSLNALRQEDGQPQGTGNLGCVHLQDVKPLTIKMELWIHWKAGDPGYCCSHLKTKGKNPDWEEPREVPWWNCTWIPTDHATSCAVNQWNPLLLNPVWIMFVFPGAQSTLLNRFLTRKIIIQYFFTIDIDNFFW